MAQLTEQELVALKYVMEDPDFSSRFFRANISLDPVDKTEFWTWFNSALKQADYHCKHCRMKKREHAGVKCLFEPTSFEEQTQQMEWSADPGALGKYNTGQYATAGAMSGLAKQLAKAQAHQAQNWISKAKKGK